MNKVVMRSLFSADDKHKVQLICARASPLSETQPGLKRGSECEPAVCLSVGPAPLLVEFRVESSLITRVG